MSGTQQVTLTPSSNPDSLALADRLDPAIGEATTVVGAMLTELLRRTLRGGVIRIGDEMHDYVAQKVDLVVSERTPVIEQLASTVAEHTARTAATEIATEEVRALEERTRETDRDLAARIETAAQAAQDKTAQTAAELSGQIQEAEQRAHAALSETAQSVQQKAQETAGELSAQIQSTERLARAAQEEAQKFAERAREGTARFKVRFTELETVTTALGQRLDLLRQDLSRDLEESRVRFRREVEELTRANEALRARVTELEKPRGLRAFFAWLFRRRPKTADKPATAKGATEKGTSKAKSPEMEPVGSSNS